MIGAARSALAAVIIGVLAVVFTVSFTAIVYGGALPADLSRGIGLALAGAAVMAAMGTRLSYRGTVVQPQDVTAVILSLAIASIAEGWSGSRDGLFATAAALVLTTTALTGLAAWGFGRLGLGFVARYIPYPVVGGFLAATGYLLVVGATGMALGRSVGIRNLGVLLEPGNPVKWAPWLLVGLAFAAVSRRTTNGLVLPGCIVLAVAGFHVVLRLVGSDLEAAQSQGLLLGPFEGTSFAHGLGPWILAEADWGAVAAQAPSVAAVVGMAIVGALLYASALEIAIGEPVDADRDLRGVGLANLLAAGAGGLVGYHILSETVFARALQVTGRMAGFSVAAISLVALFFGAGFLSVLPIGVFAAVIIFLGFDLLYTWLWLERRKLPPRDFGIVLLILAVAATIGFLQAIAVGILAASLLFIVAYARTDVVRLRTTAASLRSRVERPEAELERLARFGDRAVVYRLNGYLFFGTASRLLAELGETVTAEGPPAMVVIDFRRVQGVDASATFALGKLQKTCAAHGVQLILSGLDATGRELLRRSGIVPGPGGPEFTDRLDDALQRVEERLLAQDPAVEARPATGILDELRRLHPNFDPAHRFEEIHAAPGDTVIVSGDESDSVIALVSGSLRAEILGRAGEPIPVARIMPGTLVGEIGLYAGVPRTANVVAEEPCRLLRIGRDALDRLAREDPALAADFHRLAASMLARRLMRTTSLLRDADL
jgi:SulP family sulfate permease